MRRISPWKNVQGILLENIGLAIREQTFVVQRTAVFLSRQELCRWLATNHFSSGSSGRVEGGRETWNICSRFRWPSFLWLVFTGLGGHGPLAPPPRCATAFFDHFGNKQELLVDTFFFTGSVHTECTSSRSRDVGNNLFYYLFYGIKGPVSAAESWVCLSS